MIRIEVVHKDAVIVIEEDTPEKIVDAVRSAIKAVDFARNDLTGFQGYSTLPFGDDPRLAVFQCEKIVRGARITGIEQQPRGVARLHLEVDGKQFTFKSREGWIDRFTGDINDKDLGYYVEYDDGFTSWSPTEAFEKGYRRIV